MPEASVQELEELPPDAAIAADHRNPRRRNRQRKREEEPEVGTLVHPESGHELAGLILHRGVKQQILDGLRAIRIRDQLEEVWSISRLQPQQGRCILNFYGPPGTGKTRAALGVALKLGQPLYQVDYSAVISKYLGDTAKHISRAFERASHHGAALFLDEADSLLSKRVSLDESCATSINQRVTMACFIPSAQPPWTGVFTSAVNRSHSVAVPGMRRRRPRRVRTSVTPCSAC